MARTENLTAIIEREGDGYVALCPELDIASQGGTVEEASRTSAVAALKIFLGRIEGCQVNGFSARKVEIGR